MPNTIQSKPPFLILTTILTFFLLYFSNACLATTHLENQYAFSYLGGEKSDIGFAIAHDASGNIFIAGATNSNQFDQFDFITNKNQFNQNCFVLKVASDNPDNNFYFEFAGSERETCRDIVIDDLGQIYVTGETQSSDLPVTTTNTFSGEWDAFIFKLSNNGNLLYASYFGGKMTDFGHGIAISSIDNVYVVGETWSSDFPTTPNGHINDCLALGICSNNSDLANAFVIHINTSQAFQFSSSYSSYLGGTKQDKAHDVAIDANGLVHVVGETHSADFPLIKQLSSSHNGTFDGFLSIIDPTQSSSLSLIQSTFIGGSGDDFIYAIDIDANNNSIVTGETNSDNFPVTENAFSKKCNQGGSLCNPTNALQSHRDLFVSIISSTAQPELLYSSYIGGSDDEAAQDIISDNNIIYLSGITYSADFPLTDNAFDDTCLTSISCKAVAEGFIIKLDILTSGTDALRYSSYIGGDQSDNILATTLSADGTLYLTGETYSNNLATNNALDNNNQNGEAIFESIKINTNGSYVERAKTPSTSNQTAASAVFYSIILLISLLIFRRKSHRK